MINVEDEVVPDVLTDPSAIKYCVDRPLGNLYAAAVIAPLVFTSVIEEFPNWIVFEVVTEAWKPKAVEFEIDPDVVFAEAPI